MKFMHKDAYRIVRPPSCLAILIRNMSILQQNTRKLRYFVPQASKPTLTRYKKAGNPKGLPAQGQCISRHMRESRVSSAFVLAALSCSEVARTCARHTRCVRALSGLRPRRTPMPERRLRPRERSCGQPQPSAEDGCSGRCYGPCQRRVRPCE